MNPIATRARQTYTFIQQLDDDSVGLLGCHLAEQVYDDATKNLAANMPAFGAKLKEQATSDDAKRLIIFLTHVNPFQGIEGIAQLLLMSLGFMEVYTSAMSSTPTPSDLPDTSIFDEVPLASSPTPQPSLAINQPLTVETTEVAPLTTDTSMNPSLEGDGGDTDLSDRLGVDDDGDEEDEYE